MIRELIKEAASRLESFLDDDNRHVPDEYETDREDEGEVVEINGLAAEQGVDVAMHAAVDMLLGKDPTARAKALEQGRKLAEELRLNTSDNIRGLPGDKEGKIIMELAGPLMYRELPVVMHALLYLGFCNDATVADLLAKQAINVWHGLDENMGLENNDG